MTHTVRESGTWQHTINVEIPVEEVESRLDLVARTLARRVAMPGFRKGKVPMDRVRTEFASQIEQEFLEHFLPEATSRAIQESGLNPVVPPTVTNLRFTPGQPLTFEAQVDVAPIVEVKEWKGMQLTRRGRLIDDASIDAVIGNLREDSAVFVDVSRAAQPGDVVLLDSQRLDANGRRLSQTRTKGARIQLGSPDLLPELEAGLLGSEAGQERETASSWWRVRSKNRYDSGSFQSRKLKSRSSSAPAGIRGLLPMRLLSWNTGPAGPSSARKKPRCWMDKVFNRRSPTDANMVSRSICEPSSRANSTRAAGAESPITWW